MKLDEVLTGKAGEYKEPLAALQESMQIRTQVAGKYNIEKQNMMSWDLNPLGANHFDHSGMRPHR